MAATKKDFTAVNVNPVYQTIADATAEQLPGQLEIDAAGNVSEAEPVKQRKPRKSYTDRQTAAYMAAGRTSGRKGCKLPRINLAFTPEIYDYVNTMARAQGITITAFCQKVIGQNMIENEALYKKALAFRKQFDDSNSN